MSKLGIPKSVAEKIDSAAPDATHYDSPFGVLSTQSSLKRLFWLLFAGGVGLVVGTVVLAILGGGF